jgi:hypothetical protein
VCVGGGVGGVDAWGMHLVSPTCRSPDVDALVLPFLFPNYISTRQRTLQIHRPPARLPPRPPSTPAVAGALGRDVLFERVAPATYALQAIRSYHRKLKLEGGGKEEGAKEEGAPKEGGGTDQGAGNKGEGVGGGGAAGGKGGVSSGTIEVVKSEGGEGVHYHHNHEEEEEEEDEEEEVRKGREGVCA